MLSLKKRRESMKKTMVFIKVLGHLAVILLLTAVVGAIGMSAYKEGYKNGEQTGQLFSARYVAQVCHKGGKLNLFGRSYYCGSIQSL